MFSHSDPSRPDREPDGVDFCSLGMFILDNIDFIPPIPPVRNILGGAGTYAALGARLISPPPKKSKRVGWIVHCGSDFPAQARKTIETWQTGCMLINTPDRLTTRAWNGYGEGDRRAFKYLTPKLQIRHSLLPESFLLSSSFHLICSATRAIEEISNILIARQRLHSQHKGGGRPSGKAHPITSFSASSPSRPIFVWEPVPDLCVESEFQNFRRAARLCDVVSPNHEELAALFQSSIAVEKEEGTRGTALGGSDDGVGDGCPGNLNRALVEKQARSLLNESVSFPDNKESENGFGYLRLPDGSSLPYPTHHSVVVRCGKAGSFAATAGRSSSSTVTTQWTPAYHQSSTKVVDPTGAGNTFLGALTVSLGRGEALPCGLVNASVAASFAIEQVGVPVLSPRGGSKRVGDLEEEDVVGTDKLGNAKEVASRVQGMQGEDEEEDGEELWNGESVWARVRELHSRIASST